MQALFLLLVVAVMLTSSKALAGFVGGKPVSFSGATVGTYAGVTLYMRTDAAAAFNRMKANAESDGIALRPTGIRAAFRTTEDQTLLGQTRSSYAAPVGYSPHQGGIAIDLETDGGTNAAFRWLSSNAGPYGFRRTRSDEPWHWEFHP